MQIEAVKLQDAAAYLNTLSKEPQEWRELPRPFGAFSARVPAKPRRRGDMRRKAARLPADRQGRPRKQVVVLEITAKRELYGSLFLMMLTFIRKC